MNEKPINNRFNVLLKRFLDKKNGSINADLMVPITAHLKIQDLKMKLRFAEMELVHAMRGLDHSDYDSVFEGWERANG